MAVAFQTKLIYYHSIYKSNLFCINIIIFLHQIIPSVSFFQINHYSKTLIYFMLYNRISGQQSSEIAYINTNSDTYPYKMFGLCCHICLGEQLRRTTSTTNTHCGQIQITLLHLLQIINMYHKFISAENVIANEFVSPCLIIEPCNPRTQHITFICRCWKKQFTPEIFRQHIFR